MSDTYESAADVEADREQQKAFLGGRSASQHSTELADVL